MKSLRATQQILVVIESSKHDKTNTWNANFHSSFSPSISICLDRSPAFLLSWMPTITEDTISALYSAPPQLFKLKSHAPNGPDFKRKMFGLIVMLAECVSGWEMSNTGLDHK